MADLQKTTVKEQVYHLLREGILTQRYEMGQRMNIGSLAEELGVSNSPIREAIHMLATEGLVELHPNYVSVVELTARDMYELSQVMCYLQVGAYQHCASSGMTGELISPMEKALARQHSLIREEDLCVFVQAATCFDRCIIQGTENRRLLEQFDKISDLFFLAQLYEYQHSDTHRQINTAQHEKMLEAIKESDHPQVLEIIRLHYNKP